MEGYRKAQKQKEKKKIKVRKRITKDEALLKVDPSIVRDKLSKLKKNACVSKLDHRQNKRLKELENTWDNYQCSLEALTNISKYQPDLCQNNEVKSQITEKKANSQDKEISKSNIVKDVAGCRLPSAIPILLKCESGYIDWNNTTKKCLNIKRTNSNNSTNSFLDSDSDSNTESDLDSSSDSESDSSSDSESCSVSSNGGNNHSRVTREARLKAIKLLALKASQKLSTANKSLSLEDTIDSNNDPLLSPLTKNSLNYCGKMKYDKRSNNICTLSREYSKGDNTGSTIHQDLDLDGQNNCLSYSNKMNEISSVYNNRIVPSSTISDYAKNIENIQTQKCLYLKDFICKQKKPVLCKNDISSPTIYSDKKIFSNSNLLQSKILDMTTTNQETYYKNKPPTKSQYFIPTKLRSSNIRTRTTTPKELTNTHYMSISSSSFKKNKSIISSSSGSQNNSNEGLDNVFNEFINEILKTNKS